MFHRIAATLQLPAYGSLKITGCSLLKVGQAA
jgi:hypothetical protein